MPDNISVNYCGVLNYESINRAFLSNDVFLFPTLGENFGHVVFESMSAGCVPIISNKTPWQFPEDCGYIFECNSSDIEKMAIEIDYLCKHKNKLHMISNNSRKWSFEKYKNIIESSGYKEIIGEQDV